MAVAYFRATAADFRSPQFHVNVLIESSSVAQFLRLLADGAAVCVLTNVADLGLGCSIELSSSFHWSNTRRNTISVFNSNENNNNKKQTKKKHQKEPKSSWGYARIFSKQLGELKTFFLRTWKALSRTRRKSFKISTNSQRNWKNLQWFQGIF